MHNVVAEPSLEPDVEPVGGDSHRKLSQPGRILTANPGHCRANAESTYCT